MRDSIPTRLKTHLDVVGDQSAISGHCNSELVISAGGLAGHEVEFKDTAEIQDNKKKLELDSAL